jgi:hypothetical protein
MTRKRKEAAGTPAVQFDPKVMEALVPGPLTAAEANALFHGFKKAVFERALGAELTHHLGYGKDAARPAGQSNVSVRRSHLESATNRALENRALGSGLAFCPLTVPTSAHVPPAAPGVR